jgi:predicted unusual protein kinase regulating ubiquinone biosynthesis (AarF/ABC1/UbiB family)
MIRARYRRITFFFARIILSVAWWDLVLPRLGMRGASQRNRKDRYQRYAADFRSLAIRMGGVMIKVGQFLSARVDVLPPEFTQELKDLQDEVPPVPFSEVRLVAEKEYGTPLQEKFSAFDRTPLASASLGQVHRAHLKQLTEPSKSEAPPPEGALESWESDVVVKIQRPNIEQIISTDLAALRTVGSWLHRYKPIRKRANVPALLAEFTKTLYEEIDYLAEGRNAETFAANFKGEPGVRVPRVVWSHTTRTTLVLENVLAIKITDYPSITAAGIDRAEVAGRLLRTYLKQIFEDGFFHADPHPGNLFVNPLPARKASASDNAPAWELTFVDFGMVGHVPDNLRNGLREMVIGVGTRDSARVVKAYQMMDLLLPGADLDLIERAGSRVFERYWGKNMTELTAVSIEEMHDLADEFRELIYDMPFQVPQNVIFLGRCVGILSGMCTGLDPQFNLWEHLAPFARKLIAEEARTGLDVWLGELEKLVRTLFFLPGRLDTIITRLEQGDVSVHTPEVTQQTQRLEGAIRRATISVVFAALLLGSIQLYLAGEVWQGGILLVGALATLGYIILK